MKPVWWLAKHRETQHWIYRQRRHQERRPVTWREFVARVEANGVTDDTVIAWVDVLGRSHVPLEITRLRSGAVVIATPGPIRPRP